MNKPIKVTNENIAEITRSRINYNLYDVVVVAFSGGKDSVASFLHLLESGCPKEKIELWHHDIDGNGNDFMDWHCTRDYCRAFADAFNVAIYFSWKQGGFEGEMLRNNQPTAGVSFEVPSVPSCDNCQRGCKKVESCGGQSKDLNTRQLFPQVSPDLNVRWCSAYLKIDVASKAIIHQPRFLGKKVLFLTGERAEESPGRAAYAEREYHKTDARSSDAAKIIRTNKILAVLDRLAAISWDEVSLSSFRKISKKEKKAGKLSIQGFSNKDIKLLTKEIFPKVLKGEDAKISREYCLDCVVKFKKLASEQSAKAIKADKKRRQKQKDGQGLFRSVHAWRPVHKWSTQEVWAIIERWKINVHPCYVLGWGRCSCAGCIFGSPNQWSSLKVVLPETFAKILAYEKQFGKSIGRGGLDIEAVAAEGVAYAAIANNPQAIEAIRSKTWTQPIILDSWVQPAGADSELVGPC